jgi:cytochrome c oxidase subunit III
MRMLAQLTNKPWLPDPPGGLEPRAWRAFRIPAPTLALWFLLAVVGVLFSLLIVAYAERIVLEEWRPSPQPQLLWLNTVLLILSSVAMQWARVGARRGRPFDAWLGLLGGGAFALAFLVGQLLAWRQLRMLTAFDITSAAIAFFYLITGLHGLHILGGLAVWARTTGRMWRGVDLARLRLSIELCTTYWHFLLGLWLVLLVLLFSGNDNLELLLAICGLR